MTIENHVVSLELAKQLKEAGYPQDTIYCWWVENGSVYLTLKSNHGRETKSEIYAAPLASELGEELPKEIGYEKLGLEMTYGNTWLRVGYEPDNGWVVLYENGAEQMLIDEVSSDASLVNALAKMWLYLKSEGLL